VLASYYAGQVLIVRNARMGGTESWGSLRSPPAYGKHPA
jgi:hypothetical protein